MKKMLFITTLIAIIFFVGCSTKQPEGLELKLQLSISGNVDTEDSVRTFNEIEDMEIDSKGNIYLLEARHGKIMKFDKQGNFLTSFGSLGKELGEFQFSLDFVIIEDEVYVKSFPNKKIVKYDNNGKYLKTFDYTNEGKFNGVIGEILRSVANDMVVGYIHNVEDNRQGQLVFRHNLALMNNKFEELAVLRNYEIEFDPDNIRYFESVSKYSVGDGKIFVAENSEEVYRINVFDQTGKKISQIVHDYSRVEYNQYELEKIKTLNLRANKNVMKENKSFKKSINDVFYDKYGRLLVCSSISRNEENQKDFIIDIYKDGEFVKTVKVEHLIGEDFVRRFDSRIYFFGDKIYEIVNGEAKVNIYGY